MKIIATLCFYDEPPAWLAGVVASAARFCDHLVAVDGAYWLYPGGRDKLCSSAQAHDAIVQAARGSGIGLTLHVPTGPFMGNEVEKRNLMLQLAATVGTPMEDWVFTIDGDELVIKASSLIRHDLERTDLHVALTTTVESSPEADDMQRAAYESGARSYRHLMRLLPNLRVVGAHWVYMGEDAYGRTVCLQGINGLHDVEDALDLTSAIRKEHRHAWRSRQRLDASQAYYTVRDQLVAERVVPLHMAGIDGIPVEVTR